VLLLMGGECCDSAARWNCSASLQTHAPMHAPATPRTGAAVSLHLILAQRDQDTVGGMQFGVPSVRTACPAKVEGISWTQVMRELLQQCCPSSFFLGDFRWWRWSERQRLLGWWWGKGMFVTGSYGEKMEECKQWVREEEEQTRREEEEEQRKI
jgi:hypothetical protein